jgi:excisionase family DNA binding protein
MTDHRPVRRTSVRTAHGGRRDKLTVAELCEDLGISRRTFHEWRAKGRAPRCMKLPNGDLRIRRADFDDWLRRCEAAGE